MAIKVTQEPLKSDEFIALRVTCDEIPDKIITIHLDAIADGRTTVAREIEKAKADAEQRCKRARAARDTLKELENL